MTQNISKREAHAADDAMSTLLMAGLVFMASIQMIFIGGCSGNAAGSNQVTQTTVKTASE